MGPCAGGWAPGQVGGQVLAQPRRDGDAPLAGLSLHRAQERRQSWALDRKSDKPLAQLYAERARLAASLPPDCSGQLRTVTDDLARADQDAADLHDGAGRWAGHPAGHAARAAKEAAVNFQRAQERAESVGLGPWSRTGPAAS
jgi:hypothetical protein